MLAWLSAMPKAGEPVQERSGHAIPPLDGIRALAILLVMWCHISIQDVSGAPKGLVPLIGTFGFSGVFLFFVLSGFLLFLPFARSLINRSEWPSVKHFYVRRCLRILPVFWFAASVLFALYVVVLQGVDTGSAESPSNVAPLILLLYNHFPSAAILAIALSPPLWTLAIEWQFYLLLPWLAFGMAKLVEGFTGQRRVVRLAAGLAALILASLGIRALASYAHYSTGLENVSNVPGALGAILGLLYGSRGQELDVFALGMGVALLYVWAIEQGRLSRRHQSLVCLASGVLAIAGLGIGFWFWWSAQGQHIPAEVLGFYPNGQGWAVAGEWMLGLSYAFLLIAALFSKSWLAATLSWSPLHFIGTISYSLYVWHWVLFQLSANVLAARFHLAYPLYLVAMLFIAVTFCAASYYFIERPFLRLRLTVARAPGVASAKAP